MAVESLDGLTGEEIAKIAYAQHSIQPSGLGAVCEVLIYVFGIICTVVVALRAYVRTFKVKNDRKWRLNDYLAVIGFVSSAVSHLHYYRRLTQLTAPIYTCKRSRRPLSPLRHRRNRRSSRHLPNPQLPHSPRYGIPHSIRTNLLRLLHANKIRHRCNNPLHLCRTSLQVYNVHNHEHNGHNKLHLCRMVLRQLCTVPRILESWCR
jgi:hypothetical protein